MVPSVGSVASAKCLDIAIDLDKAKQLTSAVAILRRLWSRELYSASGHCNSLSNSLSFGIFLACLGRFACENTQLDGFERCVYKVAEFDLFNVHCI